MGRDLTRRRHGRHRDFDRIRRGSDTLGFLDTHHVRLDTAEGPRGVHDAMHLVQGEDEHFTHEHVQEAPTPGHIGLSPSFPAQTQSIDFDGSTESFHNATPQSIGIADIWSFSIWSKQEDSSGGQLLVAIGAAQPNAIEIRIDSINKLFVLWVDKDGNSVSAEWNSFYSLDVWHHTLLTWNGTTLKVYKDGVLQGAPTSGSATPAGFGEMLDTSRVVNIGDGTGIPIVFDGKMAQVSMWRLAVDSAVADIYNGGSGSLVNLNAGTFAGDLAHWWRLGHEPSPNLGKDYATAGFTSTIDIEVNAQNITDADRVADVP